MSDYCPILVALALAQQVYWASEPSFFRWIDLVPWVSWSCWPWAYACDEGVRGTGLSERRRLVTVKNYYYYYYYYYYYDNLLNAWLHYPPPCTRTRVKNREAKNGQKAMQKQLPSSFRISKSGPCFFGNRKLPASKNIQKTNPENRQKTAT
jgi:hypothetical protein